MRIAGVGTFLIEFASLSRLTGDPVYEKAAMRAMISLWQRRSEINPIGNNINVDSGKWTCFEYLVKAGILPDNHQSVPGLQNVN